MILVIKIVKFIECFYNFSYIKLIKIVYRLTKHVIINLLLFRCKMLRIAFYKFVKMSILTTLMTSENCVSSFVIIFVIRLIFW